MGRLVSDLGDENATIEELDVLLTGCINGLLARLGSFMHGSSAGFGCC